MTEIRRLERVRKDFVANVSHELRTPISVVLANAETLIEMPEDELAERQRFIDAIVRNARRMARIVSDLLDLSRIEAGRYPLHAVRVVVADVCNAVAVTYRSAAEQRQQALTVAVDRDLVVLADATALEHVLGNLVDNAVKYTPVGGHVEVRARRTEGRVRIDVADDGPGIDDEHRARIFERFYRVDPGRSRQMGGTGLGLSIVRNLTEAMGGEVRHKPNHPRGSVFRVILPATN
jgi:two-component system phosphate regulon sensor histidine kinase PhoR